MNMVNVLFYVTIVTMVADWIAAERKWKTARFVTKPLALVLLILWFTQVGFWKGPLLWFGLALVFSLLGDVFLLFQNGFLFGLLAFMVTHLLYLVGFNQTLPPIDAATLLVLVAVSAVTVIVFNFVLKGINADPKHARMKIPVIIYGVVISLMLTSAILNFYRADWSLPTALLTSVGAALFFTSDSMIAIRTFIGHFNHDDYLVMLTYHLGQLLIAFGVLLQFAQH